MTDHVEVLVIGSGFGGAVAAHRLATGGRNVLQLERGPWRRTLPTSSLNIENLEHLPQASRVFTHSLRSIGSRFLRKEIVINRKGFAELYFGKGINVVCSSNVGGGSHIYAGMLARPAAPDYWDNQHPDISQSHMSPLYDELLAFLEARPISPEDIIPNRLELTNYSGALSNEGLRNPAIGLLFPQTPGSPRKIKNIYGVERRESDMRNNSFLGSPSGAKTTLDFALIWPAMLQGLAVRDMCEVRSLHKLTNEDKSGSRYEVRYYNHRSGKDETVFARNVILAAGTLNTLRLLFRSRDAFHALEGMPRLGERFGTNGGFFGVWSENSKRDLTECLPLCGPFRARNSQNKIVQVLRAGFQGLESIPMPHVAKQWFRKNSCIVGLGRDENNGIVSFKGGKLSIRYDKLANPVYQEMAEEIKNIKAMTGTKIYAPKVPLTVQPIGGACLGSSNLDGVIDANGEVFDNPGLYIADAAALPQSPGTPPSLTIAVWSRHVAGRLLASLES